MREIERAGCSAFNSDCCGTFDPSLAVCCQDPMLLTARQLRQPRRLNSPSSPHVVRRFQRGVSCGLVALFLSDGNEPRNPNGTSVSRFDSSDRVRQLRVTPMPNAGKLVI